MKKPSVRARIKSAIREGRVKFTEGAETTFPLIKDALRRKPQFTYCRGYLGEEINGHPYFKIEWGAKGIGFGEFVVYVEDGKLQIDSEGMGPKFCGQLFAEFVKLTGKK